MADIREHPFRQAFPKTHREESHEEQEYLAGISGFESWHYSSQLRKYICQFSAIFSGIKVRVGWNESKQPRLAPVAIKNASSDRVVSSIKSENTQNVPLRLPIMAFQLENVEIAPDKRHGTGMQRRNTFMPAGGVFPDDIKVVDQRMPIPYRGTFSLGVWASNQDQHYQICEQILTLFDPSLQIQRSDEIFDWTKLSYVELSGIQFEENVPAGADRRIIQSTFQFIVDIYLEIPNVVHDKFVKEIYVRIGAVNKDIDSNYDVISDLDSQGIDYDKWYDLDYVNLKDEPTS